MGVTTPGSGGGAPAAGGHRGFGGEASNAGTCFLVFFFKK